MEIMGYWVLADFVNLGALPHLVWMVKLWNYRLYRTTAQSYSDSGRFMDKDLRSRNIMLQIVLYCWHGWCIHCISNHA